MSNFRIVTDSACDLPDAIAQELEVDILPMSVTINGKEYKNYLDEREISVKDFYELLRKGIVGKTSAINTNEVVTCLTPLLDAGEDVLFLAFSSALSGTYSACCVAAEELREMYPQRKIYVVDTLCASMGQGLLVYLCAKQRANGASVEQVRDYAKNTKQSIAHWFTVDSLIHLRNGGRLSAASAFTGTILGIKPVLHVDNEGRLIPVSKVHGRKNSIKALITHMKQAVSPENKLMFISHGDCEQDALLLRDMIHQAIGNIEIIISPIGPVIGNHSGPGTLALFFTALSRD